MTMTHPFPESCRPLAAEESFSFACHPGLACFTRCCCQLDLALTPYDVLRLKRRLGLDSGSFLEQYVLVTWEEGMIFPSCFLSMVDDGQASCVFLTSTGCRVYSDRPAACRTYPVGRGASRRPDGSVAEQFLLLREAHCLGCTQDKEQDIPTYFHEQGVDTYNRHNDPLLRLMQHPRIQEGFRPHPRQLDQFVMALYNIDFFRQEMADGRISLHRPLKAHELRALAGDDEELLGLGLAWLMQEYFGEIS
jgi:Fe-S-cluster containining protein